MLTASELNIAELFLLTFVLGILSGDPGFVSGTLVALAWHSIGVFLLYGFTDVFTFLVVEPAGWLVGAALACILTLAWRPSEPWLPLCDLVLLFQFKGRYGRSFLALLLLVAAQMVMRFTNGDELQPLWTSLAIVAAWILVFFLLRADTNLIGKDRQFLWFIIAIGVTNLLAMIGLWATARFGGSPEMQLAIFAAIVLVLAIINIAIAANVTGRGLFDGLGFGVDCPSEEDSVDERSAPRRRSVRLRQQRTHHGRRERSRDRIAARPLMGDPFASVVRAKAH